MYMDSSVLGLLIGLKLELQNFKLVVNMMLGETVVNSFEKFIFGTTGIPYFMHVKYRRILCKYLFRDTCCCMVTEFCFMILSL